MLRLMEIAVFLFLGILLAFQPLFAHDPYFGEQWYLEPINAIKAWDISTGSPDVIVAVLDTGVDVNNPDLDGNIWVNTQEIPGDGLDNDLNGYVDDSNGYDFVHKQSISEPSVTELYDSPALNHGTVLAGLISAVHDNAVGIKGMTSSVKIMPLVVLDTDGSGTAEDIVAAINYAVANGADVINMSFSGNVYDVALQRALQRAYQHNVLIVAAAGNRIPYGIDMEERPQYPACYDSNAVNMILGVGSSDQHNAFSSFSNYGGGCLDLIAPGEDILSLIYEKASIDSLTEIVGDGFDGTSFSTGLVSGTVALMRSINPYITSDEVMTILLKTANPLRVSWADHGAAGLLDTYSAVDAAKKLLLSRAVHQLYSVPSTELGSAIVGFDVQGKPASFMDVFGDGFTGINVQKADVNMDGRDDFVVGAAKDNTPFVRSLDRDGELYASFLGFAAEYKGGVQVAAGDVNGDGAIEYVVVPESDYVPVVRVFSATGQLITEFEAFDRHFKQGLTVAVGNVYGDSMPEILVGAPYGHTPEVRIFDATGKRVNTINAFVPQFTGGVNVAAANIDQVGYDEIIVGAGIGGGPQVQVFDPQNNVLGSFFVYNPSFHGGVRVSAADINNDGTLEVITSPGATGGPHVKAVDLKGRVLLEYFAFGADYTGGIQTIAF